MTEREGPATEGRIVYIDCFSGIAGDMMLAALLGLEGTREAIDEALDGLALSGWEMRTDTVIRNGIKASRVQVVVTDPEAHRERSYSDIKDLLSRARLGDGVRRRALDMFAAVAEAEAQIHGVTVDDVHFHEVGAVDSIVDIVAAAAGLDCLGGQVHCARIPLGSGFVKCRHGTIPVPAPATLELLRGLPTYGTRVEAELVTPTGAAIVKTQVDEFGPLPPMRPEHIGWGAGSRDHPGRPGLLRLIVGAPLLEVQPGSCVVLEANIDDMTAEVAAHAVSRALDAGALDAWVTPLTMKKGRPALQVGLLVRRSDLERLSGILFAETTTIGLRYHEVGRIELPRRFVSVATRFGEIPVKISGHQGGPLTVSPEFDACRRAADEHEAPVKHVLAAAAAAAMADGEK